MDDIDMDRDECSECGALVDWLTLDQSGLCPFCSDEDA